MTAYVVDTNVAVVANADANKSPQADPDCVLACITKLKTVYINGMVVLDNHGLILREYMSNLSMSGQPGAGDLFMKWVWNVQADVSHCQQVTITPQSTSPGDFAEFPQDPALANFDRSDRKFVAVALASKLRPEILNAVDTDWANYYEVLARHGVNIKFLCSQYCAPEK